MWMQQVVQCGLDVHRKFSVLTAVESSGKVVRRERLEHADREAMRKRLKMYPAQTPVFLEASFGWGWMCDELEECGLSPRLAHGGKVAQWRARNGPAKSNRRDAQALSELGFEKTTWWEVWMAPQEVRRWRELMRHRMALVGEQTAIKNRVHAALHRHGVLQDFSDLFGKRGVVWLEGLVEDAQAPLPDSARLVIRDNLEMLREIRVRLARMLGMYHGELKANQEMRRLKSLPGVGLLLAFTIMAEIGDINRFASAKKLSSYALLAPIAQDSGEDDGSKPQGRHVGHVGRATLKWAWLEAAHGAVRRPGEFRDLFNRITQEGQRDRNRGYMAVAHELCRRSYVLLRKNVDYQEDRPPRPGSRPAVRESVEARAPYGPPASAGQTGT